MIGLDTTAIIDVYRGEEKICALLPQIEEPLAVTQISYMELMFGIEPENEKHAKEERYYDDFFQSVKTVGLDNAACKKTSEIYHDLKREGATIGKFDCIIAGSFLAQGIKKIITRNDRHFAKIRGLEVITY